MRSFLIVALISTYLLVPAFAQEAVQVKFVHGTSSATIDGEVTGYEYNDYLLAAQAGQDMNIVLTVTEPNKWGTLPFFNILPPGAQDSPALYIGSNVADNVNNANIVLPENGDYKIRVYQMGDARDSDLTTGYKLKMTIK